MSFLHSAPGTRTGFVPCDDPDYSPGQLAHGIKNREACFYKFLLGGEEFLHSFKPLGRAQGKEKGFADFPLDIFHDID